MKLIYCKNCGDIYNIDGGIKRCTCNNTVGVYIDSENIVYGGKDAVCIGIDNNTFYPTTKRQQPDGYGLRFDSWVCAMHCGSTIKIKSLEKKTDNKIYELCSKYSMKKRWDKSVTNSRTGISGIIYRIFRFLMNIELKDLDKSNINQEDSKWYSNFSERVTSIANKLAYFSGRKSMMNWFNFLLGYLDKYPEDLLYLESFTDNRDLYDVLIKCYKSYMEKSKNNV